MPITPEQLQAIRNPASPPDRVGEAKRAAFGAIPPFVDDQLRSVHSDATGAYPVVIPAGMASVLLAHAELVQDLVGAYTDAGWWINRALAQPDGSFALTLAPPAGRPGASAPL